MIVDNIKVIFKSLELDISREEVWKKWTTHEGLKTFFGIDNIIELKLGGKFEIYFLGENEFERGSEGCTILSYIQNEMLSFTWNAPPFFSEVRNSGFKTYVVVRFIEKNNKTLVELRHLGWPIDERFEPVYEYFNKAWDIVMNNLKTSVNG